jgi:integrase
MFEVVFSRPALRVTIPGWLIGFSFSRPCSLRIMQDASAPAEDRSIYSFRHLWISDMLLAGVDVLLVARMAGTSVAMIERVYGHFRNQSYQDAQSRLDGARAVRGL